MYTPTTWKYGDIITEQKLNKLEQGVEDAGCKIAKINVTVTHNGTSSAFALDKTFAEVVALIEDGYIPVYVFTDGTNHRVATPTGACMDSESPLYGIGINVSSYQYVHDDTGFHIVTGDEV